jgi:zinc protease
MSTNFKLPSLKIEKYTLDNGLRVMLNPDDSSPVVSIAVYYDVGSRNERKGRDGFAHLFEHIMFQGSENVAKSEHFQLISKAGGTMNGTTGSQRTNYYETLPANQLPLAIWLESDRMKSLKITQENLENQRAVVLEEKRQRYDNQPYGQIFDLLSEMVFCNFANSHSTIGSNEDLNAADLSDVAEFFRIYYAPNNAVLTVSGSFEIDEAKSLIEKYFATIPSQPKPTQVDVGEPVEVAVKHKTWEDKLAPFPAFLIGWKVPPRRTKDFYAIYLAGKLLYEGESSRLYQKLVKGEESVLQLFGFTDDRRGPSMAVIGAIPKPDNDVKQIREVIFNEINELSTNGVSVEEMEKLRNQLINDEIRQRQSSISRAKQISEYALYDDEPELVNTELDNYLQVSAEEIKSAVHKYLNTDNRSELDVVPAAKN